MIQSKRITFSYSESFSKTTRLTAENYPSWQRKILNLLVINMLIKHILSPVLKKLKKKDISDSFSEYPKDKFDDTLVYDKNTRADNIENDITTKWIIINNLGDDSKRLKERNEKNAVKI